MKLGRVNNPLDLQTTTNIVMNSINLNTSTPIKRIRFRGDSFQADSEPLLDNDFCDEPNSTKNGELPKERGLFTKKSLLRHVNNNFLQLIRINLDSLISFEWSSIEAIVWIMMRRDIQRGGRKFILL